MAFPGISHYLADIILCIISLFYRRFTLAGIAAFREILARTVYAAGTYLRKQRVFLDFDAPSIIIRQMEMQCIQFQHRHAVDDTQQVLLRGEEPCHVHQQPAIAETGLVGDSNSRNCPVDACHYLSTFDGGRQQLADTLQSIEEALYIGSMNVYSFSCNFQFIGFFLQTGIRRQTNISFLVSHLYARSKSCRTGEKCGKAAYFYSLFLVLHSKGCFFREMKVTRARHYTDRAGN